jgi:hypothetical protein
MHAAESTKLREQSTAVRNAANTWALNFLLFALLADIMYRAAVYGEAAWDLLLLLGLSGVVSVAYLHLHKGIDRTLSLRISLLSVVVALVLAVATVLLLVVTAR